MAQHIRIELFKQKVFKKIEKAIRKDFEDIIMVRGSLKYENLTHWDRPDQREKNTLIFLTNRYIGKGFVYRDTRGDFEIHYNEKKKEISNIYLVA